MRRTPFPAPTDVQVCHQGPGGDRKSGPGHGSPRQAAAGWLQGGKSGALLGGPPLGSSGTNSSLRAHQSWLQCAGSVLSTPRKACAYPEAGH